MTNNMNDIKKGGVYNTFKVGKCENNIVYSETNKIAKNHGRQENPLNNATSEQLFTYNGSHCLAFVLTF